MEQAEGILLGYLRHLITVFSNEFQEVPSACSVTINSDIIFFLIHELLIKQAEGPPERVSPAIIAENSNKKPGGPYLGTLSLFYDGCR